MDGERGGGWGEGWWMGRGVVDGERGVGWGEGWWMGRGVVDGERGGGWEEYTFLLVEHNELDRNYAPSVCDWLYGT